LAADVCHDDDDSVRHLVELGYVDPEEVAAREAALRSRLEAELRGAVELLGRGQTAEATALVEAVAAQDPAWIAPRQMLAEMQYRVGNWLEARAHLEWLDHHGVVSPKLASIRGGIALANRDMQAALEELEYAAYVEPELTGVQSLFGTALRRLRRWDAAQQALDRAREQNPSDTQALDGLAVVALHHGEFEAAAHWALEALELDMRLFRAHYHLGIALTRLNRTEAAIEAFNACMVLEPTRAAPLRWLACIAEQQQSDAAPADQYRERARRIVRQRRNQPRP
jgi:tetratricopeptide (TPR) repeat protein